MVEIELLDSAVNESHFNQPPWKLLGNAATLVSGRSGMLHINHLPNSACRAVPLRRSDGPEIQALAVISVAASAAFEELQLPF